MSKKSSSPQSPKALFLILMFMGLGLIAVMVSLDLKERKSLEAAEQGKKVQAQVGACREFDSDQGPQLSEFLECQVSIPSGESRSLSLSRDRARELDGKSLEVSLMPDGSLVITDESYISLGRRMTWYLYSLGGAMIFAAGSQLLRRRKNE